LTVTVNLTKGVVIMTTLTMDSRSSDETRRERTQFDSFLSDNPASTGVLAGVVTMAGQIAAQFDLSGEVCRLAALVFALLLAYYQVGVAQRRPARESLFLVPIVAVIIFTGGWGANGLIYEAHKSQVSAVQPASPQQLSDLEKGESPRAVAMLKWVADSIIPSAQAAEGGNQGSNDRRRGGWKKW
jgi:hypothetical protein